MQKLLNLVWNGINRNIRFWKVLVQRKIPKHNANFIWFKILANSYFFKLDFCWMWSNVCVLFRVNKSSKWERKRRDRGYCLVHIQLYWKNQDLLLVLTPWHCVLMSIWWLILQSTTPTVSIYSTFYHRIRESRIFLISSISRSALLLKKCTR